MKKQSGYYDFNITGFITFIVSVGVMIGLLLSWIVPLAWGWIKPIIHTLTG